MNRFRKGDHVRLDATVLDVHGDESAGIQIEGYPHSINIKTMHISMVEPHVEVGELVWCHAAEMSGEVLGINDNWIWVKTQNGRHETWRALDIDRAEKEPS